MKNLKSTFIALTILGCLVLAGIFYFQRSQAQTTTTTISGKFYKLDVLATNTQLGVAQLFGGPSINDNGLIAFTGTNTVFTADGINPVRNVRSGSNFGGFVQVNNDNLVIARSSVLPNTQTLFRIDTNQQPAPATIIAGANLANFNDFAAIHAAVSLNNSGQPAFAVNSLTTNVPQLVTGIRTTFNRQNITGASLLNPMVANNGNVVVRAGATSSDPIRLYNYALTNPIDIATVSATTFSALGQSPGISDDGEVIVFYGVLNADPGTNPNPNYNQTFQTTAGPGIFASFNVGTIRRTVRIARRQVENFATSTGNLDGVCDAPEQAAAPAQCVDGELGLDAAGNALQFATFDSNARVGVVRQDLAPLGNIEGDVFIVSFIGTPNAASTAPQYFSNQRGLWTIKVEIKREGTNLREKLSRPMSVVQVGDLIGTGNQITDIAVYDPIAVAATDAAGATRSQHRPDHRVVFQATTQAGGSIIVRGTHIDTDEDGLPDHWETSGIDFNQDGTIDLPLNTVIPGDASNLAANPNRKDIYIEMDYMQETGGANPHTHQPGRHPDNSRNLTLDPILQVRNAFSANPVRNPNGSNGATLHTFLGEAVPEVFALQFLYQTRPTGSFDDFDDLKFGSNGGTPGVPCGNGPNDGHFGTMAERGDAMTCANVLGAKRLVFRYSIFAHRVSFPPDPLDLTSGVAEIAGNDFIVSLAVREPGRANDYEDFSNDEVAAYNATIPTPVPAFTFDSIFADYQAGTFMHELGHTLGLFHGGKDFTNFKPNYLSVMNYSRQFNVRGLSTINLPGIAPNVTVLSNRRLDYSRGPALTTLMEPSLLENAGVNGPAGERTIHSRQTNCANLISGTDGPIDWNYNAINEPGAISADVNLQRNNMGICVPPNPIQTLEGSDDWSNLRFNYFETINFADGSQRRALLDGKDLNLVDALNLRLGNADVDNDGVSNFGDNCIFAPNASQSDSNGNGVGDACDVTTTTLADLTVSITSSASSVQINNSFDYVLTVRNAGPNDAQNVTISNQIPATVSFVSAASSQGSCSGTATVVCNLGTIANNGMATVTIRVTPTSRGRLDNYADVSSGQTMDANILNNTGSASVTVLDPTQTFTISGRIADINNVGIGEAFVGYSGSGQGTAVTDANGNYSFTATSGGVYTLIPSKFGFNFSPQSRTAAYIDSNQVVNFVGGQATTTAKNADFDGDGKTDVSVFRPGDTNWYILRSSAGNLQVTQWGLSTDKLVPGDYDGDGKTDFAIFRPSDTVWYILQSSTNTLAALQWGLSTDVQVAGDYDGDGKTDVAVWRPSDGTWYVRKSSDGALLAVTFGQNGDIPLVGDFDGDRKTDFAFFRPDPTPDTATWNILKSSGGTIVEAFGLFDDKLVPADFDGDGTTDFGIWRPSNGFWYTAPSSEPDPSHNFTSISFGQSGDVPVPGDFNGDGKYDRAVFRNGNWIIQDLPNNATLYQSFGLGTDKPIPNIYLPQ